MDWTARCAAVIPCWNEAAQIGGLVRRVRSRLPAVIVVDDGSSDATASEAAAAGAEVWRHPKNLGKGAALQSGWRRARARGFEWALTLDGDGQHAPEDSPAFFARALESGAMLVAGDRLRRPGAMPPLRRAVNRWMTRRLSQLTGTPLADSQCGFRLVHLETLAGLRIKADHFEIESEALAAFLEAGHRVEFVPITVIYGGSPSRIRPLVDGYRWFRWWFARLGAARAKRRNPDSALRSDRPVRVP
jgi:glycosyltransferase involved in cell wall biosynthesis